MEAELAFVRGKRGEKDDIDGITIGVKKAQVQEEEEEDIPKVKWSFSYYSKNSPLTPRRGSEKSFLVSSFNENTKEEQKEKESSDIEKTEKLEALISVSIDEMDVKESTRSSIIGQEPQNVVCSDEKFSKILFDPKTCLALREFLKTSIYYSQVGDGLVLLDFWLEIENFKNFVPRTIDIIEEHAERLYHRYFSPKAQRRIVIPFTASSALEDRIATRVTSPKLYAFDEVQKKVFQRLKQSYPKLKLHDIYKKMKSIQRKRKVKEKRHILQNIKSKLNLGASFQGEPAEEQSYSRLHYEQNNEEAERRIREVKEKFGTKLLLDRLGLDSVPTELETTSVHLSFLDLSMNRISSLPKQMLINNMMALSELYLDFNFLTQLPSEITFLPLKVLSINFNQITKLPPKIGNIGKLKYLGIQGNKKLLEIPLSIVEIPNLLELRHDDREHLLPMELIRSLHSDRKMIAYTLMEYLDELSQFSFQFKQKSHWIPDREREACVDCQRPFTNLRRRHHCRFCGDLFCSRCSSFRCWLPMLHFDQLTRVCDICFTVITTSLSGQRRSSRHSL